VHASTFTTNVEQTAGTLTGPPDSLVYAVVGFDGSASSLRALDAAGRLLNDRPGGMEIVYIPHLSALITGGDVGGLASAEVSKASTTRPASCPKRSARTYAPRRISELRAVTPGLVHPHQTRYEEVLHRYP